MCGCAEYVALYVAHILNVLPKQNLGEFIRGFKRVCGGPALDVTQCSQSPRTLPFPLHMVRSHVKPMARACATDRSNIQTHHRSLGLIPCLSLLCRGGAGGLAAAVDAARASADRCRRPNPRLRGLRAGPCLSYSRRVHCRLDPILHGLSSNKTAPITCGPRAGGRV